ncbi:unnamed protein product, partial [Closterium sp. NIES-54]
DAWVDQFTPGGQRVTHCTCSRTGRHLATFTRRPGSSLYTLTTAPPPISASSQVFAAASRSSPASAPCSCRPLSHETLLWHHHLGHPSLPRLRGMASGALVSGLPRSVPPLPPGPAPTCVPCVEGRQRTAPHSSSFPPTEAPLQTLHMDVWGPAHVRGQGHERYFLLVVDDYSRYNSVFRLRSKGAVLEVLIAWIRGARRKLSESFGSYLAVLRLHSDRGGEFSSDLLIAFCRSEGIRQTFTLPVSPQQNGKAERRIGMVMDVARTSMIHAAAPHFLWPFAVQYAAHQINLQPRVSLLGTTPTLLWTGKVGDASVFCAAGAGAAGGTAAAGGAAGAGGAAKASGGSAGACAAGGYRSCFCCFWRRCAAAAVLRSAPFLSRPPVRSQSQLQPASPLPGLYSGPTGGLTERREPESRPVSPASHAALPVGTVRAGRVSRQRLPPVPGTHSRTLRASTAPQRVPLPSPPASSLPHGPDPQSDSLRAASPTVTRFLATAVTDPLFESTAASALVAELVDFAAACCLDYATSLVAESASVTVCPPSVRGECALGTDVLEDRQEEFECFAASVPHLVSMLLAPEGDPDAPDISTPRSYAEAIEGPYSSQWQAAMDAEMASWKSTGTYVDEVPPPGANIVSGMWIFRVKRPPGSPPAFKARYVARGFSQRQGVDFFLTFSPTPKMTTLWVLLHVAAQRDYELHSLDFSTAFLQGSLHEEIWLRRPPGFTGSFPASIQWSLWRPVYGLRQAPRKWHDTLRTTLASLGFSPSTADPSLFLRTDATLPPFYVLVYVNDFVFAKADTEALAHVKSELQKSHTCTDLDPLALRLHVLLATVHSSAYRSLALGSTFGRVRRAEWLVSKACGLPHVLQRFRFTYSSPQSTPLPTGHLLSAPPSDESVEPSGLYPELVGCLMHRKVHWDATKRVLRYLCSTSGMGLVLGGRARVVLTGHAYASRVDDLATQRSSQGYTFSLGSGSVSWRSTRSSSVLSSSCEAEIYAGAMAAQELCWLTYLLTDLGEAPRSPPVMYIDNKAMLALCHLHRLEHRTKHIALCYFLARELQLCGLSGQHC